MSSLTQFRDYCRKMAAERKPVIARTAAERALWTAMADEIDEYLTHPAAVEDLFGEITAEPTSAECDHDGIEHSAFSYTGICPSCRKCKFIGHGPLCLDCLTAEPDPGLAVPARVEPSEGVA